MIFIVCALIWLVIWLYLRPRYTQIELRVKIPPATEGSRVRFIGSIPVMGRWQEHGCEPDEIQDNIAILRLRLRVGQEVEFKTTLGDWSTVQKGPGFEDTQNFRFHAEAGQPIIEFEVHAFGGQQQRFSKSGKQGYFDVLPAFRSEILDDSRPIMIWLPPSYFQEPNRRYPVLYMHDGNNLFDPRTAFGGVEWQVDETCETLMQKGLMREVIVVGIYNSAARLEEYTPTFCSRHGGGEGRNYLRFMVEELKPWIQKRYRIQPQPGSTGIMGSSLGGLISLWAGFEYPDEFGLVGSISPSLWWDARYMIERYSNIALHPSQKIWIDMGSREGMSRQGVSQAMQDTRDMVRILEMNGFEQGKNLFYFEHVGAYHNEASWAARLHMPLLFFFGGGRTPIQLEKPWLNAA